MANALKTMIQLLITQPAAAAQASTDAKPVYSLPGGGTTTDQAHAAKLNGGVAPAAQGQGGRKIALVIDEGAGISEEILKLLGQDKAAQIIEGVRQLADAGLQAFDDGASVTITHDSIEGLKADPTPLPDPVDAGGGKVPEPQQS